MLGLARRVTGRSGTPKVEVTLQLRRCSRSAEEAELQGCGKGRSGIGRRRRRLQAEFEISLEAVGRRTLRGCAAGPRPQSDDE